MSKEQAKKEVCHEYYEHYLNSENPMITMEKYNLGILDKIEEIENNNGWVKIESEDDLPKDYDVRQFNLWLWTNNGFYEMQDYKRWKLHYDHLAITHCQLKPIEKPKPPIY